MSASSRKTTPEGRLVGFVAGLRQPPEIAAWTPPTQAEVDASPALPPRPLRGWSTSRPGRGEAPLAAAGASSVPPVPPAAASAVHPPVAQRPVRPDWIREGTVQALAWERPQDAAGVIRARLLAAREGAGQAAALQELAALCIGLGEEVSSAVLQHLGEGDIEEVALAIAALQTAEAESVDRALHGLEQDLLAGTTRCGGPRLARAVLERTLGSARAQDLAARLPSDFASTLARVQADRIAPFIAHEHPQTIALFLSQQPPVQAAGILSHLPLPVQEDVAYRMATLDNVPRSVLQQLWESLEQSLRELLGSSETVGGPKVVADMLNVAGSSVERNVLERLDAHDPEAAEAVRNLMFVFEDIIRMSDHDIQRLLREVDQTDTVVALKGASPALRERILTNVSQQVKEWLRDQDAFLGLMRLSEVEDVRLRIVQMVRQLEEQGEVTIVRGEAAAQLV